MGDIIVLVLLAGIIALVVRSIWKNHKKGGRCSGCSGACAGCSGCLAGHEEQGKLSADKET